MSALLAEKQIFPHEYRPGSSQQAKSCHVSTTILPPEFLHINERELPLFSTSIKWPASDLLFIDPTTFMHFSWWTASSLLAGVLAFGVRKDGRNLVIDNESNTKVRIGMDGAITFLSYKDTPYISGHSIKHQSGVFGSGLRGAKVSYKVDEGKGTILVSVVGGNTLHTGDADGFYVFRKNIDAFQVGGHGHQMTQEFRYILRLDPKLFPHCLNKQSDTRGGKGLETGDVYMLPDGSTASKFFSAIPAKYNAIYGLSGNSGGNAIWFDQTGAFEGMSGGAFHKDILCERRSDVTELMLYFYSGHSQTEPARNAVQFATIALGPEPTAAADLSYLDDLDIPGYVPSTKRGIMEGKVSNMQPLPATCVRPDEWYAKLKAEDKASVGASIHRRSHSHHKEKRENKMNEYTIAIRNKRAQYWIGVDEEGRYKISGIIPGNYIVELYENQRVITSTTTEVDIGAPTIKDFSVVPPAEPIWHVGCWDGAPFGFHNADLIERNHPSDKKMHWPKNPTWSPGDPADKFPMAQIMTIQNPLRITFTLNSTDKDRAKDFFIAITADYRQGRPTVIVNNGQKQDPGAPPPVKAYGQEVWESRTVTHGAYNKVLRGYRYEVYKDLKVGNNVITVDVSGIPEDRTDYTNPSFIYDFVALY